MNAPTRFPYAGWPAEAVDLVEQSIRVHGGWDAWKRLEVIRFRPARSRGLLPFTKGRGGVFGPPRRVEIRPHRGVAILEAYPGEETTGLWENGVVSLVDARTTETLIGSAGHRKTFAGRARRRRWTPLDVLYFLGFSFLHDYAIPFTLGEATWVSSRPVRAHGETLVALELEFPGARETHSARQTVLFGDEGLVRRRTYVEDIVGLTTRCIEVLNEHEQVDGLTFATRRRVSASVSGIPIPGAFLETTHVDLEVEYRDEQE